MSDPWKRLAMALMIRLDGIAHIIEDVDNRCMAADGPVTDTRDEMTKEEMREIYRSAKVNRKRIPLLKKELANGRRK